MDGGNIYPGLSLQIPQQGLPAQQQGLLDRISDHPVARFVAFVVGLIGFLAGLGIAYHEHEEFERVQAQLSRSEQEVAALKAQITDQFGTLLLKTELMASQKEVSALKVQMVEQFKTVLRKLQEPKASDPGKVQTPSLALLEEKADKSYEISALLSLASQAVDRGDEAQAFAFMMSPVLATYPPAQFIIGTSYACGCGVKADPILARLYVTRAAAGGYPDAIKWLKVHPN